MLCLPYLKLDDIWKPFRYPFQRKNVKNCDAFVFPTNNAWDRKGSLARGRDRCGHWLRLTRPVWLTPAREAGAGEGGLQLHVRVGPGVGRLLPVVQAVGAEARSEGGAAHPLVKVRREQRDLLGLRLFFPLDQRAPEGRREGAAPEPLIVVRSQKRRGIAFRAAAGEPNKAST